MSMKSTKMMIHAVPVLLGSVLSIQFAAAQCDGKTGLAKTACEVASGVAGSRGSGQESGQGPALISGAANAIHADTLPAEVALKAARPLVQLDRTPDGSLVLVEGVFEGYLQSYSLDADEHGQARAAAFLPAPIEGSRASMIALLLKEAELRPDVAQTDIQQLLWAIVGGGYLEKMPAPAQRTAASMLSQEMLATLQAPPPTHTVGKAIVGIIERRLTKSSSPTPGSGQSTSATASPVAPTNTNPLPAAPLFVTPNALEARGTWVRMPAGFFVRYLPDGYTKITVQVIVPEAAVAHADRRNPVLFDPTQYLAVFAGAPTQRLGVTLRPAQ